MSFFSLTEIFPICVCGKIPCTASFNNQVASLVQVSFVVAVSLKIQI